MGVLENMRSGKTADFVKNLHNERPMYEGDLQDWYTAAMLEWQTGKHEGGALYGFLVGAVPQLLAEIEELKAAVK